METMKKNEEIKICCEENCARPVSNTGRVATKNNYSCCIDYLKIRVAGKYSIEDEFVINLFKLLYLNRTEYDMIPSNQYSIFFQYDEETFILGGNKDSRLKDGNDAWYLELKGQGCRMLEQRFMLNDIETPRGWYELFEYIYRTNTSGICDIKILRIDATLDDYTGKITQEEIERKYVNHFWTSRSRSLKLEKSIDFENLKNHIKYYKDKGWTLTHGGRTSRQLCIYNKKAERKARGYESFVDSWMRFESRYFDDNADWAFLKILNGLKDNKFNEVVYSLIGGIIEFKEDSDCERSQMYRVKTWNKWEELLNNVSAIKYVSQKKIEEDITLNKKKYG